MADSTYRVPELFALSRRDVLVMYPTTQQSLKYKHKVYGQLLVLCLGLCCFVLCTGSPFFLQVISQESLVDCMQICNTTRDLDQLYHQHGSSSALTSRQSPSAHLWLRPSRHEYSLLLLLPSAVRAAFVVSFLVPLHHTTSARGLHHLCCPTSAPWEPNHSTSLHRVFFAFWQELTP